MSLMKSFFNNARKPKGLIGKWIIGFMNGYGHELLAEWALKSLNIEDGNSILDVGCGGGGNISRLLKRYPHSVVKGVDYSHISVDMSKKINIEEIAEGRCEITYGNVVNLPYDDCSFDIVTAFETVYYWPQIEVSFKQVLRVLKDNGSFAIVNGADAEGGMVWDNYIDGMHTYTAAELEQHLKASGFAKIEIRRKRQNHYICIVAHKERQGKDNHS